MCHYIDAPAHKEASIYKGMLFELPAEIRAIIWAHARNQHALDLIKHYSQVFQVADIFADYAILAQDVETHWDLDGLGCALWQVAFDHLLALEDGYDKYEGSDDGSESSHE